MPDNTGRLFKNPDYTEGSKRPQYKGQCNIDGKELNIAAWVKTSKNGKPYFYISFEKPGEQRSKTTAEEKPVTKSKNRSGIRPLDTIPEGKKVEKVKTEDMDVAGIPF